MRIRPLGIAFIVISLIVSLIACGSARAAGSNVELIIDASGSMAQRIGGQSKLETAKKVLLKLAAELPPDTQVAVRTYGSNRKDDCSDIVLLAPLGPRDPGRFRSQVIALKPRGMTPIAGSLELAAKDFTGLEGQHNVVILVSDGEETCHADPCAAARALHAAGIHLEVDVIGFNVLPKEREQLKCIADASGGKYLDAADAREFSLAAGEMEKRVAAAPPPAPQASPTPFNLLAQSSGGEVLIAPSDAWKQTNDGQEKQFGLGSTDEAVYGFKDGQSATFDTFAVLIPSADSQNLKEFELLAGNDSPSGPFTSIGKFTVTNAKMMKSPYQQFKFAPVIAKYFKVKLLSSYGYGFNPTTCYEFALYGKLGGSPAAAATPALAGQINLLAQSNGGQVLIAPSDAWKQTNDGQEKQFGLGSTDEAVFAFKDEQPANFDTFSVYVPAADAQNLKEFELFAGNDSPTGPFTSIGKFTVMNAKVMKSPYQEFKFAPVTAKYLKVKLLSSYGYGFNPTTAYEFRLMGKFAPAGSAPRAAAAPAPSSAAGRINLLAQSNGGEVLIAPNDAWKQTNDGEEKSFGLGSTDEAVFGFKGERPATFDTFAIYVPAADSQNIKDFELLSATSAPTGPFTSIGKFTVMNAKMMKSPYQEFKFAPVTAKYLKVKLLSSYGYGFNPTTAYEFRLMGTLR